MRGVVYVAYGREARQEALMSSRTVEEHNPGLPISLIASEPLGKLHFIKYDLPRERNRWAKLNIDTLSPYNVTAYLDADTRVTGRLTAGFEMLEDGWDMAMALSKNQETDWLWHCSEDDRQMTEARLRHKGLQYGAGVMFVAWGERTRALWAAWREEWGAFCGQDQGAFMRALQRVRVRLWILGGTWNGGSLVTHRYGMARAR